MTDSIKIDVLKLCACRLEFFAFTHDLYLSNYIGSHEKGILANSEYSLKSADQATNVDTQWDSSSKTKSSSTLRFSIKVE